MLDNIALLNTPYNTSSFPFLIISNASKGIGNSEKLILSDKAAVVPQNRFNILFPLTRPEGRKLSILFIKI